MPEPSHYPVNPPGGSIPGISQAVLVERGPLLFLSGHVPLLPDGRLAGGDLDGQSRQVFENIGATLNAAGGGFENLVRITIYVRDYRPEMLGVIRSVRDHYLAGRARPASALVGVVSLFDPEVMVEIDAVAALPGGSSSRALHPSLEEMRLNRPG